MQGHQFGRFVAWSSYVSAGATVAGFVTLVVFFSIGGLFGIVNDVTAIIIALSMMPIAVFLFRLNQRNSANAALATLIIGLLAMVAAATIEAMLVLGLVDLQMTLTASPAAFGFIGLWLLLNSVLSRNLPKFPAKLSWLGVLAGASYVLVIVGFLLGGEQHPLTAIGGLAAVVFYPIWAIGLGRLVLSGQLPL